MNLTKKEFAVASIAGCLRVRWVFDGSNRDYPDDSQLQTFEEAVATAHRWCLIADTVGGDAKVVHVPTMMEMHWFRSDKGTVYRKYSHHAPERDIFQ